MPDGIYIGLISLLTAVLLFMLGWLRYRRKDKVEVEAQRQAGLSERFDDASELAKYIDARVEEKVKPIREKMDQVKKEADDIQDAFREWVSAVWIWHQRGRVGDLPMPADSMLAKLGLTYIIAHEMHPKNKT